MSLKLSAYKSHCEADRTQLAPPIKRPLARTLQRRVCREGARGEWDVPLRSQSVHLEGQGQSLCICLRQNSCAITNIASKLGLDGRLGIGKAFITNVELSVKDAAISARDFLRELGKYPWRQVRARCYRFYQVGAGLDRLE